MLRSSGEVAGPVAYNPDLLACPRLAEGGPCPPQHRFTEPDNPTRSDRAADGRSLNDEASQLFFSGESRNFPTHSHHEKAFGTTRNSRAMISGIPKIVSNDCDDSRDLPMRNRLR